MELTITKLSNHTGAAATGVDLTRPINAETQAALNRAFTEHSVLVVRDQQMTPHQVLAAVRLLGDTFIQHNTRFSLPECPEIHYISNQDKFPDGTRYIPGEGYHTDHSNDARPPKATVLYAVTLPDRGGDTQYVNMHRAYETLSPGTQARIADLKGIHVYQNSHSTRKLLDLPEAAKERVPNAVLHPIVRTHPETGRKAIYINPIRIEGILGLSHAEALPLLDQLLEHAVRPEHQYRHQWHKGDLVFWDNRCLLHKANGDYDMNQLRYLYRVMLKGSVPM